MPNEKQVQIKPQRLITFDVVIEGTSPLVTHAWSSKAREMMKKKHSGDKSKNRDVRNPEEECREASYRLEDGRYGIPTRAIMKAIVSAADKDLGIPKTHVRKGLSILAADGEFVPIETPGPKMREDMVRVGQGSADIRYRPQFSEWRATIRCEIDEDILTVNSVVNLLNRAGFGVGLCENRPEKGGDWGRFRVVGGDK